MSSALRYWVLAALSLSIGCKGSNAVKQSPSANTSPDPYLQPAFVDISAQVDLEFTHDAGPFEDYAMPRIMGSGACMFDYDNDQDLDILLINGESRSVGQQATGSKLFRQEPSGKFTDVTKTSGLEVTSSSSVGYGMGAATGDIDNDGDLDLYLTRYGDDRLLTNQGDGTFEDITTAAGINNPQWASAASFFDYDRDGWLDLYVANYVDYFPGSQCEDASGRRDFCGPESLSGTVGKLYRNRGSSASSKVNFEDVTISSGIARRKGKGLGVLCRDFTGDGYADIFVANDGEENTLWVQYEGGVFSNEALLRGVALNRFGEAEANMGVVAEDLNNDGQCDLFVTHLREESSTLFRGQPFGQFIDDTVASGFSITSLPFTGFGVAANDVDNDGAIDLAIVNGGVKRGPVTDSRDVAPFWRDYAQRNEFYLNDGKGHFTLHDRLGGSDFAQKVEVSRALVSGDIDNDGDVDLLVTNCGGPARLYRNDFPKNGAWLSVLAVDEKLKRVAIGAQIQVRAAGRTFARELNPSSGYLGGNDLRVYFGLGKCDKYDAIRVLWPDGSLDLEEFEGGAVNAPVKLVRGAGRIIPSRAQ